jgi:hypothetical protein
MNAIQNCFHASLIVFWLVTHSHHYDNMHYSVNLSKSNYFITSLLSCSSELLLF